jgi:hypothetical protein
VYHNIKKNMCVSSFTSVPLTSHHPYILCASKFALFILHVVIDVCNMYEILIDKFKGAVDPCTKSFTEFTSWVDDQFQLAKSETQKSGVNTDNGADKSDGNKFLYLIFVGVLFFSASWTAFRAVRTAAS